MAYVGPFPLQVIEGGTGRTSLTNHGVLVGAATAAITQLTVGTSGQVLIGATGANPAFATITSTGGTITFTPGANTLNMESNPSTAISVTAVNTTPYVVLAGNYFLAVNSTGGARQINLPNAPATGTVFIIKDAMGQAATNNITVTTVGGAVLIDGLTSQVMASTYESIQVVFDGTAYEIY